jgi:hypothetical protein
MSIQLKDLEDALNVHMQIYWRGPCDVYIPCGIASVVASDGRNRHRRDGIVTEIYFQEDNDQSVHNIFEYREKYAVERHGLWFYDIFTHETAEVQATAFVPPTDISLRVRLYRMNDAMQILKPEIKK